MSSDGDSGAATAECPSLPWRLLSSTTMVGVSALCRGFLYGLSHPEVNGLESFLEVIESRKDPAQRSRGLLTGRSYMWTFGIMANCVFCRIVSNHTSVYVR